MVARGCNNSPVAATVRIFASKKTENKVKARIGSKNNIQITTKSKKRNGQNRGRAGKVIEK